MTATVPSIELPVHLTRFVGRETELAALEALLQPTRLLTLTGAGGSGKTRLARELAARCGDGYERVGWVDFAPLSDPALAGRQVADALRVPERDDASAAEVVAGDIAGCEMLLVLDNCEHLVDACAALAETLLRQCPRLRIVATSREALGVPSETSWLVPPLASAEATQLFVDRAQAASATFRLTNANTRAVEEICRRLDGIPLAIELAAARVRALSPEQIAERLHDAFRLLTSGSRTALPRHRTLRGVIEWSYSLLTPRERALLARLSVFHGSFSLEAAEAVCAGDALVDEDILDGVAALVEKSLVVMEGGDGTARYRLLETVRQYGAERLAQEGVDDALREKHALYFIALSERMQPLLVGGEHELGLAERLKADHDNIRAACAWALAEPSRREHALRLSAALFWFWYCTGHFHEAREFLDATLPHAQGAPPRLHGGVLQSKGLLEVVQMRLDEACDALSRAAQLQEQSDDAQGAIVSRIKLAAAYLHRGEIDTANRILDEADAVASRFSPITVVFVNFWRGWSRLLSGDLETARALFIRNCSIGKVADHHTSVAHSLTMLGFVAVAYGKLQEAATRFADAIRRHQRLGDLWGLALDFDGLAAMAVAGGDFERGVMILAGVEALRRRAGFALPSVALAQRDGLVAAARAALGERYDALYARGAMQSQTDMIREALERGSAGESTPVSPRAAVATPTAPVQALPLPERTDVAPAVVAGLEVDALGPLRVTVDGQVIEAAAWGSARSRELLVYLLLNPEGATKEQVGAALWPDASAAQLRNNFHVTLHRLRKTLGHPEWVIATQDRYLIDPAVVRRFDAREFETSVEQTRRALRRREDGAVLLLERAVALYRGEFLDGEPAGDWHLETRDRLQVLCIDALMALGAAQLAEDRLARAVETYRLVLARDELHEEGLRALMVAQARLGERTAALRAYQRFAERLRRELEAEPSRETRALFERLQAGQAV